MDSQVTPDSLFEQTLECTGYDQWRLRRRIRNLRKIGDHKKRDKIVQQIASDLDAAKARLSVRKQALPCFQFPPELPVSEKHEEIAEAINANQVVILAGETGSGKTTQLPKICLSVGLGMATFSVLKGFKLCWCCIPGSSASEVIYPVTSQATRRKLLPPDQELDQTLGVHRSRDRVHRRGHCR